jgi:hypothetical protein
MTTKGGPRFNRLKNQRQRDLAVGAHVTAREISGFFHALMARTSSFPMRNSSGFSEFGRVLEAALSETLAASSVGCGLDLSGCRGERRPFWSHQTTSPVCFSSRPSSRRATAGWGQQPI